MNEHNKTIIPDGWEIVVAKTIAEVELLRPVWEKLQKEETYPVPNADIDRFISVIEPFQDSVHPHIILLRHNGNPDAMAIGRVERTMLDCRIGYKTLLKPTLKCLSIVYGGLIGKFTDETGFVLLKALMRTLAKGEIDLVCFNHIRIDSSFYLLSRKLPSFFAKSHFLKVELHWRMTIPTNIERFYATLSKKHRNHLKGYLRKLEGMYPGQIREVTFSEVDEVAQALRDATNVSERTYQFAMGCGFVNDKQKEILLRTAAQKGWFRGHILYVGEKPVAFRFALKYKNTYFGDGIGYVPEWGRFRVGTILFLKVLDKLYHDNTVTYYDFGFGDADYKHSYGSEHWREASVYIFASRPYPIFINMMRTFTMGLNMSLEYVLNRTNLTGWIKRRWRDLLQRRNVK